MADIRQMDPGSLLDKLDLDSLCEGNRRLRELAEAQKQDLKVELSREGFKDPPPRFELNWANRVILTGLPLITPAKLETLKKVLIKLTTKLNISLEAGQIDIPIEGEQSSGVAFLSLANEDLAKQAIRACSGLPLDAKHTLAAYSFEEFDRILGTPETYTEPAIFSKSELMGWLVDSRDQFVLRHEDKTSVYWNDVASRQPELLPTQRLWSDRYVYWSASGTYLASLHQNGVILWAGGEFSEYKRFSHAHVLQLEFSPCERYLLTCSPAVDGNYTYVVWDVRTGKELRTFTAISEAWGAYKWSNSGDYLAKISQNLISVYKSEDMQLLEDGKGNKTSIKAEGIKSFMWSPGSDILSYFVVAEETSRIKLVVIPSREELHSRTLTNAQECSLVWQGEGQFLAALATNFTKKGKPKHSTLEIFFFRKRDIPVCTLKLDYIAQQLCWETQGSRFSLLSEENHELRLKIYQLNAERAELEVVSDTEAEGKEVFWAPQGGHFVVCNRAKVATGPGLLKFFVIKGKSLHCLNSQMHPYLSHVEWDQSGLHLISSARQPLGAAGSSTSFTYTIWTCQGQAIYSTNVRGLYQVLWRPRPKYALPREKQQEAEARMQQQAQNYIESDRRKAEEAKHRFTREKDFKHKQFFDNFGPLSKRWTDTARERAALVGYTEEQERRRWREEVTEVETFLKTKIGTMHRSAAAAIAR